MTVNTKVLDDLNLTNEERDSIIYLIETAWKNKNNTPKEHLAANFLKSLTNYNIKINTLKLLEEFEVEQLANCMKVSKKVDIDTLIIEEMTCNC